MTERTKMPVLNADLRATSFDEVALGFTEEQALKEANRCLHCKNPMCKSGCPVQIDIPEFIAQIKQKNYEKEVLSEVQECLNCEKKLHNSTHDPCETCKKHNHPRSSIKGTPPNFRRD